MEFGQTNDSLDICYASSYPWTNCRDFLLILESRVDMWEDVFHFSPIPRELPQDVKAPEEMQSPASLECHIAEQPNWSEELCPVSIQKGRLDK